MSSRAEESERIARESQAAQEKRLRVVPFDVSPEINGTLPVFVCRRICHSAAPDAFECRMVVPDMSSVATTRAADNDSAASPWKFRFTVLTATYNRAHTLNGVYESLCAQTFRDFEWLIIDDGSADETAKLVASWKPWFALRYVPKPNGGKHTAINLGARLAEGKWILIFDSDDRCVPSALERFDHHVKHLPDADRFANVSCLCANPDGTVVGSRYPGGEFIDVYAFAEQVRLRNSERWSIKRTEVLRQYPFPEGECFVPDGLVWNRMSRKYATRFINESLRVYLPRPDGLSARVTKLRILSPKATRLYYRELIFSPAPAMVRIKAAINYFSFLAIDIYRNMRLLW